ncbi:BA14K family protein [Rhizobium sp. TRM95796]|uniref:BA14K family protein n=1 Tax=Rhizobium sp. TRM95796 TaxID=2979862 RepID=UPI0021E8382B|nr:BA14K family protein [Rhizobium sp. TRM95796]MCV3764799.1 BA14K family protein [Rhizobium sp. TRM95796]
MNRLVKSAILGAAALAATAGSFQFASAGGRDYYWRHAPRHHHHGDAVAAGVIGLAAGAIIGGALAADPEPEVIYRPRRVYVEPEPVYVEPAPRRVYVEPAPRDVYAEPDTLDEDYAAPAQDEDYYPARPARRQVDASAATLQPWTARWRAYCAERYQSFNARTGTYRGYDGQDHFCTGA